MYIDKIYRHKQTRKILFKIAKHFETNGDTPRWNKPCINKLITAIENGRFTFIKMSDGKTYSPKGKDSLKQISKFFNIGGLPPHQNRSSGIAAIRAMAEGEIDLIDSDGRRFWE